MGNGALHVEVDTEEWGFGLETGSIDAEEIEGTAMGPKGREDGETSMRKRVRIMVAGTN